MVSKTFALQVLFGFIEELRAERNSLDDGISGNALDQVERLYSIVF